MPRKAKAKPSADEPVAAEVLPDETAVTEMMTETVGNPADPAQNETPESTVSASSTEDQVTLPEAEQTEPVDQVPPEPVSDLTPEADGRTDVPTSSSEKLPIAAETAPAIPPQKTRRRGLKLLLLFVVLLGALLAIAAFVYMQQRPGDDKVSRELQSRIARLAVVPPETPRISTVIDPSQTDQPFLDNALKGDKVLLYVESGRAIVYRPSTDQIVNMGPLVQPEPQVFVRSGTGKPVPESFIAKINGLQGYRYVSQDSATSKNYKKTIVVDVSGSRPDVAERLAQELGVSVGELPPSESRPDADMLIIVGSDIQDS